VSPAEEKKLLLTTLKYLDKPKGNWSWPMFFVESIVWLALVLVALWLFQKPGGTPLGQWLLIGGALVVGIVLGVVSLCRNSNQRWAVLGRFVDKDLIRSRLNELGA
jgi:hypothetical protein